MTDFTNAELNVLIQGIYLQRSPAEDRLHDNRISDFEKTLCADTINFFDALLAKLTKGN